MGKLSHCLEIHGVDKEYPNATAEMLASAKKHGIDVPIVEQFIKKTQGELDDIIKQINTAVKRDYPELVAHDSNQQKAEKSQSSSNESVTPSEPESKKQESIADFGEVLLGAKKHYAQKMSEAEKLDTATVPLSKSWPEPDYEKLIEQGFEPYVVAMVRAMREAVPAKGRSGWKVKQYVDSVETLRKFASELLSGEITKKEFNDKLDTKEYRNLKGEFHSVADLYQAVGHKNSLKGIRVSVGRYSVYKGEKFDPPKTIWSVSKKAKATAFSNWPTELATGDTREEAIANFKEKADKLLSDLKTKNKGTKFVIYTKRDAGDSKAYIGKKFSSRRYLDLESFDSLKEARKYLAENQDKLEAKLEKVKKLPGERKETNAPRVGEDHRAKLSSLNSVVESLIDRSNTAADNLADIIVAHAGGAKLPSFIDVPLESVPLSGRSSDMNTALNKLPAYRLAVFSKFLGNLNNTNALTIKGYSSLDVPAKRLVQSAVLAIGHDLQVRGSIVELIPVDVVDNLGASKLSANSLFSNKSVLGDSLSVDRKVPVGGINPSGLSFVRAIARVAAEGSFADDISRVALKNDPAVKAGKFDRILGEFSFSSHNVTPQHFMDTFSFFGVQFGNYVTNEERQQSINEAYDALMDMAGVLGIPAEALSLNGELGLAFGARGSGGKGAAAAHYEPGTVVINLTKKSGAGSLAHEWWHALDNYFNRQRGEGDYFSQKPKAKHGYNEKTGKYENIDPTRQEMIDAFAGIMQAIEATGLKERSQITDQAKSKPYWATDVEMSARAFENYIIEKLNDNNGANDYLANIVSQDVWDAETALGFKQEGSYPYLTKDEIPGVKAAYQHFFDVVETKKTDKGTALYSVSTDTRFAYRRRIDELFNGADAKRPGVRILDRSDLLDMLGFGNKPVNLAEGKIRKGLENHKLKAEHWKRIPLWLEDPAFVFDSDTVPGDLVFIPKETLNGDPITISIHPVGNTLEANIVTSAYERKGKTPFNRWVDDGLLRYFTKEKSAAKDRSRLHNSGMSKATRSDKIKIYRDADLVKYRSLKSVGGWSTGNTVEQVESELKGFLGVGFTRLTRLGKLRVVESSDVSGVPVTAKDGSISGYYDNGVVTLIADRVVKGDAEYLVRHEILHMLMAEDPIFSKKRDEILGAFKRLKEKKQSVEEAYARVPEDTREGYQDEEAFAYWSQQPENHKHVLFRRVVAAIKAWLYRHGVSVKKFTEADLSALVTQGVKSLGNRTVKENLTVEQPAMASRGRARFSLRDSRDVVATLTGDEIVGEDLYASAKDYFQKELQGNTLNREEIGEIRVTGKGWHKVKRGLKIDSLKVRLIPAIPKIIEDGNYRGREAVSERSDDIVAFHYFDGYVDLGGKIVQVGVTVGEDSRGNLFYNLNHDADELWKTRRLTVNSGKARGGKPSADDDGSPSFRFSIADDGEAVNLTILDDDGLNRSSALSDVEFNAAFARVTAGAVNREGFTVVESAADLPEAILADAENYGGNHDNIEGVFHNGRVYIVRKHVSSIKQLESIVFHEWYGHAGLYAMMGNDGIAVRKKMVELYNLMQSGRMQKIADKYGFSLDSYAKALRQARDRHGKPLTDDARHAVLMEEMLAYLTEEYSRGKIATKVKEIIGMIRAWLRKNGFVELANLNEADMALLLKQARTYAEAGAWSKGSTVVFNGVDILQRLRDKGITEDQLAGLFGGLNSDSAVKYALNPNDDPAVMDRMKRQLYVPERIYEGTGKIYAEGSREAEAEKVARGSLRAIRQVREISRSGWPEGEYGQLASQVLRPEESKALKAWAEKNGLMLDNDQFNKAWESSGKRGGTEHDVYYNESDGRWYKRQRFTMSDTFTDYFQRLALMNHLNNGLAEYRLEGFVENNGELQPVVSQADVVEARHRKHPSIAEVNRLMKNAGFERVDKAGDAFMGQFRLPGQDYIISDHYKGNVARATDGNVVFIDPLIKPDLETKKDRIEASILAEKYGLDDVRFSLRDKADIDKIARSIKHPKRTMSNGVKKSIRMVGKWTPEKLKEVLGQVAGSPWFSSEGHPFMRMFVNLNLVRGDNRNGIIWDVAKEQDGYLGHEGMRRVMRTLKKNQRAKVNAVIKQGDIDRVEYTDSDLKAKGFSESMIEAYKAFRQTIEKANKILMEKLKELSLLPYEGSSFFEDLKRLVDEGKSINATAKALGVDQSLMAAFNTLQGLRGDIEKGLSKYKGSPYFDDVVTMLVAGKSFVDVQKEYGLSHDLMRMFREGLPLRLERRTLGSYEKSGFYRQLKKFIVNPDAYAEYKKTFDENYDLFQAYKDIVGYKSKLAELKKELRRLVGYAPRIRKNGEWLVRVFKTDTETKEKHPVFMQITRTEGGAGRLAGKLRENRALMKEALRSNFEEGAHYEVTYERSKDLGEDVFLDIGSDLSISELLDRAINASSGKTEELSGLRDNVYRLVANNILARGFGRHKIGRSESLIEGYQDEDYLGVLKQYVGGMSGWLSKSEFAIRAQLAMREGEEGATPSERRWVRAYIKDALRNSNSLDQIGATFRAYAALMMLGGKVSTTALNSTQNYILGQAELSRHGVKRPTWVILMAQRDILAYHSGKRKLSAEETEMLETASRSGRTKAQYAREIFGQDEGIIDGGVSGAVGWLAGKAMFPFQLVETYWNREPMLLAAFREFRKQGMEKDAALEKAEEIVNNVHFAIGKENRPEMVRKMGAVGTGAYTFQSFTHNYLLWLANRIKAGELDPIARSMTALVLLGGLIALPGADDLDEWWMKLFGESPQRELRRWLRQHGDEYFDAGEAIEDFVLNGIPSLAGVNFSGSLSVRIPFMGAGEDTAAERFGGVLPSLLWERPKRSIAATSKGNYLRALENAPFTPEAVSNLVRAYRYYADGATTMSGKPIFGSDGRQAKYTGYEAMLRMVGFMPLGPSKENQNRWNAIQAKTYWRGEKADLLARYRAARSYDARKAVYLEIVKFNKRLRESSAGVLVPGISSRTLRNALRARPNRRELAYNH